MHIRARKLLMALLVSAYVVQTGIVYLDDTASTRGVLSPLALEGRRLWHSHNCQACHQLYGMGGFLGPDLTNAAARLTRARLDSILTRGSLPMPAFGMRGEEIDAIEAYQKEIDRTGIGVARSDPPLDRRELWSALASRSATMSAEAGEGLDLFRSRCAVCHVPFQSTSLGLNTAPDLSTVRERLSAQEINETLENGRPDKGMPPTYLDEAGRRRVMSFLAWLRGIRPRLLLEMRGPAEKSELPWWEYR